MNDEPMIPPDENRAAIRALLDTLHRQQGDIATPDVGDLGRWLDGTLPPERAARVELALARNPALRQALTALQLGLEEPVPADELARLENLVGAPMAPVEPFPAPSRRVTGIDLLLAAAAAAVLLVPAWSIGAKTAEQRREVENRELREFLKGGL